MRRMNLSPETSNLSGSRRTVWPKPRLTLRLPSASSPDVGGNMARALAVAILSWAMVCTLANAQPRAIENPVWLAEPNGEDFREHYPDAAVAQAVEGSATI